MRLAAGALAVDRPPTRPEQHSLDGDLAAQQLVVRAPDDAKAARSESLEQAIATEHQLHHRRVVAARDALAGRSCAERDAWTRVCGDSTGSRVRHP